MKDWKGSTIRLVEAAIVVLALVYIYQSLPLPAGEVLQQCELVSRIAAFVAVAAFVLYKLFAGFHLSNMSIELSLKRGHRSEQQDILAITIALVKGDRGTIKLLNAAARVICDGDRKAIDLPGLQRLHTGELRKGVWQVSDRRPYLYFTPGEKTVFGTHATVPHGSPCIVEVVFAGKTPIYWRSGQWRASCVSLPLDNAEPD